MGFGVELTAFVNAFDKAHGPWKTKQELADEKSNRDWVQKERSRRETDWAQSDADRAYNRVGTDTARAHDTIKWGQDQEDRLLKLSTDADTRARTKVLQGRDDTTYAHDQARLPITERQTDQSNAITLANQEVGLRTAIGPLQDKVDASNKNANIVGRALAGSGYDASGVGQTPDAPTAESFIEKYSAKYGVPAAIAKAVMQQESGGNQNVVSSKGAKGAMQLMPDAASDMGVDRNTLEGNIEGGVKYLSAMHKQFGYWPTALAAYNHGPGNVGEYIKTHSKDDLTGLPKETQDYISRILGSVRKTLDGEPTGNTSYTHDAHDMVRDTLNSQSEASGAGTTAIAEPGSEDKTNSFLLGHTDKKITDVVGTLMQKIREQSPKGTSDEEIGMRAFAALRQTYNSRGKTAEGIAAASDLLNYYKAAYNKYAAVAAAAASDGNNDAAMKAALKAYANVPDGQEFKYEKMPDGSFDIRIFDSETKKEITRHVLTPDQVGAMAMKLADPNSFHEFIVDAAGMRQPPKTSEAFQEGMKTVNGVTIPGGTVANQNVVDQLPDRTAIPTEPNQALRGAMSIDEGNAYAKAIADANPKATERDTGYMNARSQGITDAFDAAITGDGKAQLPPEVTSQLQEFRPRIENIASKIAIDSRNVNITPKTVIDALIDLSTVDKSSPKQFPGVQSKQNADGTVLVKSANFPRGITMAPEDADALERMWQQSSNKYVQDTEEAGRRLTQSAEDQKRKDIAFERRRLPKPGAIPSQDSTVMPGAAAPYHPIDWMQGY